MRWSLAQLLLVVLVIGMILGIHRGFWGRSSYFNSRILFATNLAALTTSTLAAVEARPRWRRFWLGYAAFGWCYLALVLRGGFGFTPDVYADNLARFSVLGMILGLICALVAHHLPGLRPPREGGSS
jgi:hypothetical protein